MFLHDDSDAIVRKIGDTVGEDITEAHIDIKLCHIMATLKPTSNNYTVYFVGRGKGNAVFSKSKSKKIFNSSLWPLCPTVASYVMEHVTAQYE